MLPNYLANIKSSGFYRFVFDKSEMPGQTADTLRLLVGYSERGPFNTPVYVEDQASFTQIFGGRSKKLERYGMWFHRMALQALKVGPIICLNLKNFEDAAKGKNRVDFTTFNPNSTIFNTDEEAKIISNLTMTVKELYNTDRFWTLEPEHLEELAIDGIVPQDKLGYITITNTDSKENSCTIFMRGYEPKGFDVSFDEWYSTVLNGENLPSYLESHERDMVSQYWAEIFIFKGEFTPEIATSEKLAKFFNVNGTNVTLKPYITNAFGEKIDTLSALAQNDASNFIRSYSGILLPDFRNANNTVISLDAQVNADNYLHKLMMRLNQDMLYNIDINDPESFQISDIDTTGWYIGPEPDASYMPMSLTSVSPVIYTASYDGFQWNYTANEGHEGEAADFYKYEGLAGETPSDDEYTIKFSSNDNSFGKSGILKGDTLFINNGSDNVLAHVVDLKENKDSLPVEQRSSICHDSDIHQPGTANNATYTNIGEYGMIVQGELEEDTSGTDPVYKFGIAIQIDSEFETDATWKINGTDMGSVADKMDANPSDWTRAIYLYPEFENGSISLEGESSKVINIEIDYADGKKECYGIAYAENPEQYIDYSNNGLGGAIIEYSMVLDQPMTDYTANSIIYKCVGSMTATSANLKPLYLKGYVYDNDKPASTKQIDKLNWQHYMLDALTEYKGIREALTNRVDIRYRYLVDTYEGFVESECKGTLAAICKKKDNVFGILNFPNMKSFSRCDYTSFRDDKNQFDTKYIPMGGNPTKPMAQMFTLPSQEDGASWVGFFTSLNIKDVNTGIRETVPSAALVSNDFMNKYTKYYPYTIIAGTNRGMVSDSGLQGPDFNFSRTDLDNLEPFGVNCMVYIDNKGTCINSNQTAKQNPVTALSKIHVRELCIFLQDDIEQMLEDYHWDFNTPALRDRVKERADVILETCKNNGGVYEYLNVCDESNNTDDVINNEMFVLSTSIEPTMGAGKMVQTLTIYRKGGLSAAIAEA